MENENENNISEGLTPSEISKKYNIPAHAITRWIRNALIEHTCTSEGKIKRYEIKVSDLEAFLKTKKAGKYRASETVEIANNEADAKATVVTVKSDTTERVQPPAEIGIRLIKNDPDCQIREKQDNNVIAEYADAMKGGAKFPPVDLFVDNVTGLCFVGDGYHRISAAHSLGLETITANVHPGGKIAAIKHALHANHSHGLRLTSADKRRAIQIALKLHPKLSNVEIAKICTVSESSVRNHRDMAGSEAVRIGGDGKKQKARKKKPSAYRRARSAITRVRCTPDDAVRLIDWLKEHYKLQEPTPPTDKEDAA